jgi:acyl carrier protein
MANDMTQLDLSDETLLARVRDLVGMVLDETERGRTDINSITAETLLASLPLDSLTTIELMYSIEEAFDISMTEDQTFEFRTVGDVMHFIQKKRAAMTVPTVEEQA